MLDLVNSLRPVLQALQAGGNGAAPVWQLWERWSAEVVADFWSVARIGVAATTGLMGVVSLPRVFVFRLRGDDPHPLPWIRVLLSCALGQRLYPHPQWQRLAQLWEAYYPADTQPAAERRLLAALRASLPTMAGLLAEHRPAALRGASLPQALEVAQRQPAYLAGVFRRWQRLPQQMYDAAPVQVFAVLGQARVDGTLSPEEESVLLSRLLTHWALRNSLTDL